MKFHRAVLHTLYAASAVVLLVLLAAGNWQAGQASAALLASRSIRLSDSGISGSSISSGVGSGTNVTYGFSFTTSANAQSLVVDFCGNSPLIADSCTAPTGFDASAAALTAGSGMAGWTLTATTSQLKLTGSSVSAGSQSFTITGVTNPTVVGSYYARMYTFSNTTYGTYSTAASPGNYVDYGGIALSTANIVQITAKVQETLTFCVSGATPAPPGPDCGLSGQAVTAPAISLGHGANNVLDNTQIDTNSVYTQASTNASSGVTIRMHTATAGALESGSDSIPPVNAGANTPVQVTSGNGVAFFGLMVQNSTFVSGAASATGAVAGDANYNDGTNTTCDSTAAFGMDTTTSNNNVTTTYGDSIAASSAPVNNVQNLLCFGAQASLTTPAGLYTANIALIATGVY